MASAVQQPSSSSWTWDPGRRSYYYYALSTAEFVYQDGTRIPESPAAVGSQDCTTRTTFQGLGNTRQANLSDAPAQYHTPYGNGNSAASLQSTSSYSDPRDPRSTPQYCTPSTPLSQSSTSTSSYEYSPQPSYTTGSPYVSYDTNRAPTGVSHASMAYPAASSQYSSGYGATQVNRQERLRMQDGGQYYQSYHAYGRGVNGRSGQDDQNRHEGNQIGDTQPGGGLGGKGPGDDPENHTHSGEESQ